MSETEYMTQSMVAESLHVSEKTLESMRCKGSGPKYFKFGRRVLYRADMIRSYLSNNCFLSTSEY